MRFFRLAASSASTLAVFLLSGCAGGSTGSDLASGGSEIQIDRIPTAGAPVDLRTHEEISVVTNTVELSPEQVWGLLPRVYEELALPVTFTNHGSRIVGARSVSVRRKLGEERLSTYLECGSGIRGNRADRYGVNLTVLTQVIAPEDRTKTVVATHVDADARASGVGGSTRVRCATTGRLEAKIVARVRGCVPDPQRGDLACIWAGLPRPSPSGESWTGLAP